MEKYTVKVNNTKYTVEFDDSIEVNDLKEVTLNGKKVGIDVNMDTLCSIMVDNNSHKINGVYDFDGELVKLLIGKDYHNIEVEEIKPIKIKDTNTSKKKKDAHIKAPMPGKITSIDVAIGDLIEEGQNLMALEAMKMENRIKSPKAGTLKDIRTSVGATCNSGDLLMVIE
ncbi:MAG: acetyl-CoA carboxylase biotin carboxyl carrier protein subunit [bacterium]